MIKHSEIRIGILLSPFNVPHLVLQESVLLSEFRILHSMIFWSRMSCYRGFSKKNGQFNVKCHFAYTMKIHKYERMSLLMKYARNVTRHGVLNFL